MKLLPFVIAFASLVVGSTAFGQTVNLVPEDCGLTANCPNVKNDAGLNIEYIYDSVNYQRITMYIDGNFWDTGARMAFTSPYTLYDASGNVMRAYLDFKVTSLGCTRSGRVTVCRSDYRLVAGKLVL